MTGLEEFIKWLERQSIPHEHYAFSRTIIDTARRIHAREIEKKEPINPDIVFAPEQYVPESTDLD